MSSPDPFAFGQSAFGVGSFGTATNGVGSQADIVQRLQRLIPTNWFSFATNPIVNALLNGFASVFAYIYSLAAYLRLQTRLDTTTDGWLDLAAYDFFGFDVVRGSQTDAQFLTTIQSNLFRQRGTLESIYAIVESLGLTCIVTEPMKAASGNVGTFNGVACYDANGFYDANGSYGSDAMPYECFAVVFNPGSGGGGGGYGSPVGGYSTASALQYVGAESSSSSSITTAQIAAAITSVLPVCGVCWLQVVSGAAPDEFLGTDSGEFIETDSGLLIEV